MEGHLNDGCRGELISSGVRVCLTGLPNAGKSSILNALSSRDISIVSPTAGTTRDVVTARLDLGGVLCVVSDTAGIREGVGVGDVEEEGVRRAKRERKNVRNTPRLALTHFAHHFARTNLDLLRSSSQADVVVEVVALDETNSPPPPPSPDATLTIYNKADLTSSPPPLSDSQVPVSCVTGDGLRDLTSALSSMVKEKAWGTSDTKPNVDDILITRRRHRERIAAAHEALVRFEELGERSCVL